MFIFYVKIVSINTMSKSIQENITHIFPISNSTYEDLRYRTMDNKMWQNSIAKRSLPGQFNIMIHNII
ncbi:hypothetical protein HZS_109 [Henneguya salminicola]|nr:hypothetical protein HZS_109 [Henneguya salminicola]